MEAKGQQGGKGSSEKSRRPRGRGEGGRQSGGNKGGRSNGSGGRGGGQSRGGRSDTKKEDQNTKKPGQQQKNRKRQHSKKEATRLDALAAESAVLLAIDAEATRLAVAAAMTADKDRNAAAAAANEALARENEAVAIIDDWNKQLILRAEMRQKNAEAVESRKKFALNKKKLKSDLKRTTAFVKKVKGGITDELRVSLLTDAESLNLSLYVTELISAVAEIRKTKDKDVAATVAVCSSLHQRYDEFSSGLFRELMTCMTADSSDDEKRPRAAARLAIELCCVGIYELKTLESILSKLELSIDAILLTTIVKALASDIFGLVPHRIYTAALRCGNTRVLEAAPSSLDHIDGYQELYTKVHTQCIDAYDTLLARLQSEHISLRSLEKRYTREAVNSGGLTQAKEKALEDARKARDKLLTNLTTAADCLRREPPVLPGEEDIDDEDESGGLIKKSTGGISLYSADFSERNSKGAGAFDDEAARAFYEDYPNVLDTLPAPVLGITDDELRQRRLDRETQLALWKGASLTELRLAGGAAALTGANKNGEDEVDAAAAEHTAAQVLEDVDEDQSSSTMTPLTRLITEELPACLSREIADDIATRFCEGMGVKLKARKRLVKALAMAPRMQLDLVPYLARVAAIVSLPYRDVAELLVSALYGEFVRLCRRSKSSSHTFEARLKNAKFLAELLMFRVAPPRVAFSCLHRCLDDFTNHNVDIACALLEQVGGFLLRSPRTSERAVRVFDTMLAMKKDAKPLGPRETALVDSAYYHCFPAKTDSSLAKKKPRSQLYKYLEYLLIDILCERPSAEDNEALVDDVIKALRRLPWDSDAASSKTKRKAPKLTTAPTPNKDETVPQEIMTIPRENATPEKDEATEEIPENEETVPLVVKHFLKLARHRADAAAIAADALSGLHKYRPIVSSRVVDSILEAIDVALETPASRRPLSTSQRLVSMSRFYAELYNFQIVSTQQLLSTLEHILNYGHFVSENTRSMADALASYDDNAVAGDTTGALGAVAEEEEDDEDDDHVKEADDNDADDEETDKSPYSSYSRRAKYSISEHASHDPRVPCAMDEAGDFLRVTLCCGILRTAASCIVAIPAARGPLQLLVDKLQCYFFTKPVAALGPRYAILDAIDDLERGAKAIEKRAKTKKKKKQSLESGRAAFPVRSGWYEAHDAVEAALAANAAIKTAKARLKAAKAGNTFVSNDEVVTADQEEDEEAEDEEDDDEEDYDEEDDDEEEEEDDEEEDEDDEEEEDDDDDDDEEEEDEDYQVRLPPQKSPEDIEFDQAFDAMLSESLLKSRAGPSDAGVKNANNMVVPSVAKRVVTAADKPPPPGGFKFQVLRRGAKGRLEARELFVPEDSSLATQVQRNEEEQRREHSILKATTLMQARKLRD